MKSHNEKAKETHIKELERRGIEPTQENIDKLIIEIEEKTIRLDSEKETMYINKIVLKKDNWKEGKEIRMDNAAYELSDEIWPIKDKLEKANLLISDILEDFFRQYDPGKEEDRNYIAYYFNKFTLLTDISQKLIWDAFEEIEVLEKRATKIMKEKLELEKGVM